MGNYGTSTDLLGRFGSSEEASFASDNEATDSSTYSSSVFEECIGLAEGKMDSYIGQQFLTPVDVSSNTTLAALLKSVMLDLAEHYVLIRSPESSDRKKQQHDAQVEWLALIAAGDLVLTGAETPPSSEGKGVEAFWSGSNRTLDADGPRVCSRDTMEAF